MEQRREYEVHAGRTSSVTNGTPLRFGRINIIKAIYKVENETQFIKRQVMNVLDEVGDIIHDDCHIKQRAIRKVLNKPAFKEKIAVKFLTLIKHL